MDMIESYQKDKNFGAKTERALENLTLANLDNNRMKLEKMFLVNFAKRFYLTDQII